MMRGIVCSRVPVARTFVLSGMSKEALPTLPDIFRLGGKPVCWNAVPAWQIAKNCWNSVPAIYVEAVGLAASVTFNIGLTSK